MLIVEKNKTIIVMGKRTYQLRRVIMITLFRRIAIGVVLVLVIITGGLWIVSGKAYTPPVEEKYVIKVYHKSPEKFDEIVTMLTQEGKTPIVNKKVKTTIQKPVAFVLSQKFSEDMNPEWHVQNLKKKKIGATLTKNPDGKTYSIEINKAFKKKEQAEALVAKIKEITFIKFDITEKTKEFTITTNELIIENLDSQEAADEIKAKVAPKVVNPETDIVIDVMASGSESIKEEPSETKTETDKPEKKEGEKEEAGKQGTEKSDSDKNDKPATK